MCFPSMIDLAPIGIPIGAISIRKCQLQSKFGLDEQGFEQFSLSADVRILIS